MIKVVWRRSGAFFFCPLTRSLFFDSSARDNLACEQAPRLGQTKRNWSRQEGKTAPQPPLGHFSRRDQLLFVFPSRKPSSQARVTVFIRLNAARLLNISRFECGVYSREAFIRGRRLFKIILFLANNSMVTEHLNFKKQKTVLVLVWKFIFYIYIFSKLRRLFEGGVYYISAQSCSVYSRAAFIRGRRLIE